MRLVPSYAVNKRHGWEKPRVLRVPARPTRSVCLPNVYEKDWSLIVFTLFLIFRNFLLRAVLPVPQWPVFKQH